MEESKTKLLDDNIFSHNTLFNYDFFLENIDAVNKDLYKLKSYEFLVMIWELTKLFNQLSTSLSVAFSDITDKVNIWRNLFKNEYKEYYYLQDVVEKEIILGIQELNGENNKRKGHLKGTQYYLYVSGTRTLLRIIWFLDFMIHILNYLLTTEDSLSKCVKISYEKALGIYHPWYVRSAAAMGLSFISSSRTPLIKIMFDSETWDDNVIKKVEILHKGLSSIYIYVKGYYTEKKLNELP